MPVPRLALALCLGVVAAGCRDGAPAAPTPPSVTITAPVAGAVTGTVTLTASASSPGGIAVIEWKVNGALLPAPDSTPPYQHVWNTADYGPGIFTWKAVARDRAGVSAESPPVSYTVSP